MLFFFFFQAEDGIRDKLVTGVQTCALPIWRRQKLCVVRPRGERDIKQRGGGIRTLNWQLRIREEHTSYGRNLVWRWIRWLTGWLKEGRRGWWLRPRMKRDRDTVIC